MNIRSNRTADFLSNFPPHITSSWSKSSTHQKNCLRDSRLYVVKHKIDKVHPSETYQNKSAGLIYMLNPELLYRWFW